MILTAACETEVGCGQLGAIPKSGFSGPVRHPRRGDGAGRGEGDADHTQDDDAWREEVRGRGGAFEGGQERPRDGDPEGDRRRDSPKRSESTGRAPAGSPPSCSPTAWSNGSPRRRTRYVLVKLTAPGRTLIDAVHENRRRSVSEALAEFTPEEARTLAELLERFVQAWPRTAPRE